MCGLENIGNIKKREREGDEIMTSTDICGKLETEKDKKEIGEKWKKENYR